VTRWNIDRGKKITGGRIRLHRKKKKFQRGSISLLTEIGKEKKKIKRTRGNNKKIKLVKAEFANIFDTKTKKSQKLKILDVIKNPSNPQYVRRGIITKGSIIKTELGEAKVVSRSSQHGIVNAILVEQKSNFYKK